MLFHFSTRIAGVPLTDDRLMNAANMNTRSYLTVTRQNGQVTGNTQIRSMAGK